MDEQEHRIATTNGTIEPRINDRIRSREVRLVDQDGQQLGIKLLPEAINIARLADLDLVEVAPLANPPVCRIMDYGKFKFDAAQRAKESRRKAQHVGVKEMKYRPKIGPGDFDTKTRQVAKFLGEGHKVKITIMFRGREVIHSELGKRILDRVAEVVGDAAKVEASPRLDGRNMTMVLAPDKRARQSAASRHHDDHEDGGPVGDQGAQDQGAQDQGAQDQGAQEQEQVATAAADGGAATTTEDAVAEVAGAATAERGSTHAKDED